MTTFDEDFTEEDMAAGLEWKAEDDRTCNGCGLPLDESAAFGADDDYDAELYTCHACAAMERKEKAFRQQDNAVTDGLKRRVRRSDFDQG